jgi:radical SAM superfamily enzyme YgiQ (UPF0313 family)
LKLKCILINPWIYDFAAINLWSRPLGLLQVGEYLSQFDLDLRLIDCNDVLAGPRRMYGTGKYPRQIIDKPEIVRSIPRHFARYGISLDTFEEIFKNLLPCDFILVTSVMTYWYPGVKKAIELVKYLSPNTPVILGGIYATLYPKHASDNSGADCVYQGHINQRIVDVLRNLGYNPEKKSLPIPYYRLGLYQDYPFAPILTSQGCPYSCSYCASSRLFNGFFQRDPLEVVKEIKELYKIGVRDYAFYDDALLVNADSHLKVILKEVIKLGLTIRFHCPNGIHARFIDDELAYLMKESGFETLRLGLETINEKRQKAIGEKITPEIIISAIKNLRKYGFTKRQIGVYLMYGLPGQELKEVEEGVEFVKSLGVRIYLTEFSPLPGTSSWDELKEMGIIDDTIDPLLTNNTVFAYLYSGYDWKALENLKLTVKQYNNY